MAKTNLIEELITQTKLSKKTTHKQQKIVEAAIKLFAEKGYANTSTSEIAQIAEVAEGTIFRHYGTKNNLLLSVILPFFKDLIPKLAEELFSGLMADQFLSFEDFLRALIKDRIEFIKANQGIMQIVVKELMYNEDLRKELMPLFSENVLNRIIKVIDVYKERDELIKIPSDALVRMISTFIAGYFISRFVFSSDKEIIDDEAEVEKIISFIMDGIRARQAT